jgi:HD-GYP domain-containing protein (c-di-GMP phosphodiesterase class II)
MLIQIPYTELLDQKVLEFDLYEAGGEQIYQAGTFITINELKNWKNKALYRSLSDLPIDHEGYEFEIDNTPLTEAQQQEVQIEDHQAPIYGAELTHQFLHSMRYFFNALNRGAAPDIALCEVIRDKLIAEITTKVEQVHFLTQLRVRDAYTYSHTMDVSAVSIALAIKAGFSPKEVREIALAAIIHDLGKIMIPKAIMFKPTRLTEKEFEVMKLHPALGYKMIKEDFQLPEHIALPALEHQEMYGGGGYPQNLKGDEIHPYSQIVKIADVYDALTSKRPYKEAIPSSKAINIMLSEGAKSFNPDLLALFVDLANHHAAPKLHLAS